MRIIAQYITAVISIFLTQCKNIQSDNNFSPKTLYVFQDFAMNQNQNSKDSLATSEEDRMSNSRIVISLILLVVRPFSRISTFAVSREREKRRTVYQSGAYRALPV